MLNIKTFDDCDLCLGDCLEILPQLPTGAFDLILCDLPYGVTQNKWDSVLPLDRLWAQYRRVLKPNGAVVLTCQMPFTIVLGHSNLADLRYEWIWDKVNRKTGHLLAKSRPMKVTESALVFYSAQPTYNPQWLPGKPYRTKRGSGNDGGSNYGTIQIRTPTESDGRYYPVNLIRIPVVEPAGSKCHPTQKPVDLMAYFIKTYTNKDDLVLDNCMGGGTTGVACKRTNRAFFGIEISPEYFDTACRRVAEAVPGVDDSRPVELDTVAP